MNNIIEIKGLEKKYKNGFQFGKVDVSIKEGRIVGIIGQNGAGKTTLLKCLLNILLRDDGDIEIFGKSLENYDNEIKEKVGIVMDDVFLPEIMTPKQADGIMDNLYSNWDSREFYNYLDRFDIPLNKKLLTFSSGMLKKFQLSCALAHHPKILILDEPTNGLDPIVRNEVFGIFREFTNTKGNTILLSSHDTNDLENIVDDVLFVEKGRIIIDDTLENIRKRFGIAIIDEKTFAKVERKDYLSYMVIGDEYQVLVPDEDEFKKKYKKSKIKEISLEELMVLMVKGVK